MYIYGLGGFRHPNLTLNVISMRSSETTAEFLAL